VMPKTNESALNGLSGNMRELVLAQPLTYSAIAFSIGFVIARVMR
jgi:hypothetical protein